MTDKRVLVIDAFQTLFSLHPIDSMFERDELFAATSSQFYSTICEQIVIATGLKVIGLWQDLVLTGIRRVSGPEEKKLKLAWEEYTEATRILPLAEGARSLLEQARRANVRVHLVSTCDQYTIERLVHQSGIKHLIYGIHSVETVRCYPPDKRLISHISDLEEVSVERILYATHQVYDTYVAGVNGLAAALLLRGRPIPSWPSERVRRPEFIDDLQEILPMMLEFKSGSD